MPVKTLPSQASGSEVAVVAVSSSAAGRWFAASLSVAVGADNQRGERPVDYLGGVRGKAVLYSSSSAADAVGAACAAKELVAGCFANFSAVRRRVLQWWSDVSETDAELMPDLNTRCILVCGGDFGAVAAADKYLAAALAWQLVQAAEVIYGVEGQFEEATRGELQFEQPSRSSCHFTILSAFPDFLPV